LALVAAAVVIVRSSRSSPCRLYTVWRIGR
jgi:hypothetical protein